MQIGRRELFGKFAPGICPEERQNPGIEGVHGASDDVQVAAVTRRTALMAGVVLLAGGAAGCAAGARQETIKLNVGPELTDEQKECLRTLDAAVRKFVASCEDFYLKFEKLDCSQMDFETLDALHEEAKSDLRLIAEMEEDVGGLGMTTIDYAKSDDDADFLQEASRLLKMVPGVVEGRHLRQRKILQRLADAFERFIPAVDDTNLETVQNFEGVSVIMLADSGSKASRDAIPEFANFANGHKDNRGTRVGRLFVKDEKEQIQNLRCLEWLAESMTQEQLSIVPQWIIIVNGLFIGGIKGDTIPTADMLDVAVRTMLHTYHLFQEHMSVPQSQPQGLKI